MNKALSSPNLEASSSRLYAVLTIDELSLVVAHGEVRTLEPASAVQWTAPKEGRIPFEEERWPVFCLAQDLTLLREVPPDRRVCVLLSDGDNGFGLLCNQVRTVEGASIILNPVPGCMQNVDSPVTGLALEDERVGCFITTAHLSRFLRGVLDAEPIQRQDRLLDEAPA